MGTEFWMVAYSPESGEEYAREPWPDNVPMDEREVAERIAKGTEATLDDSDGFIPNCCGDIRVEFRRDPDNAVIIFSGESFYFKREDY